MTYVLTIGVLVALFVAWAAYRKAGKAHSHPALSNEVDSLTKKQVKTDDRINKAYGLIGALTKEVKNKVFIAPVKAEVVKIEPTKQDKQEAPKSINSFPVRLRNMRERRNMSQSELGEKIGFSGAYISMLEREALRPSDNAIKGLCDIFKVEKAYLLNGHPGVKQAQAGM